MMGMWHCAGGGWAHWVWMAGSFVLWALLITAVVLVVRYLTASSGAGLRSRDSREEGLLAERYARGEIDDGEYQRRMTVLRQHR